MNIKEQVISLRKEVEALKKETLYTKEIQEKMLIIKKENKALLHSLIVIIVLLTLMSLFRQ